MTLRLRGPADHVRMPWANGRGVTTELVRQETADGRLIARLSVADVVEAGPFSALPGIDRQLLLIEGEGFDLSVDGSPLPVRPLAPVAFPGEAAVAAVALLGSSRDFNVMTGRGLATATLFLRRANGRHVATDMSFAYAVSGAFRTEGMILSAGDLLAVEGEAGRTLEFVGAGLLVLVDIRLCARKKTA